MTLAQLITYYVTREYSHPAEAAKMVARSFGGEFLTHKHIPQEYADQGFYGGMSMPDNSLILCGETLKCIKRSKELPYYEEC